MPIPSYVRGKLATLYGTFSINGTPTDPTNLQVTVYYQETVKIPIASAVKIATGYFYKEISVNTDWELDYYSAVWTGTMNGVDFRQNEVFKVIKEVSEVEGDEPTDAYCTVQDVRDEIAGVDIDTIPNIDSIIADEILKAEDRINKLCHRTFKTVTRLDYLSGNDSPELVLPARPIQSVEEVIIKHTPDIDWIKFDASHIAYLNCRDTDGILIREPTPDVDVKKCHFMVDVCQGKLIIPARVLFVGQLVGPFWNYVFNAGYANVMVNWTSGYPNDARPEDINHMCSKMVGVHMLVRKGMQISGGASSVNIGGAGRSYAGMPFAAQIQWMEQELKEIIQQYRLPGVN